MADNSELSRVVHLLNERFIQRIRLVDGPLETQCWMWTARLDDCGYGWFSCKHKNHKAHKYAYEAVLGSVPCGQELDHLCRNRACANPFHVEPVTHTENVARGIAGLWQRQKTHCSKGHPFDAQNTYVYTEGVYQKRGCLICRRARSMVVNTRRKLNAQH